MKKNLKVALLFSGQVRDVGDTEIFRRSLKLFMENINYSIYIHTWNEMGKSLCHDNTNKDLVFNLDSENYLNNLFNHFPIKAIKREKFRDFEKLIPYKYYQIHKSKNFSPLTRNSFPQIYSFYKSFTLFKDELKNYDLILRVRFDNVFIQNLLDTIDINRISSNLILNQNFGRAYYPKRIYDIFFGGSYFAMNQLSNVWNDLPNLINDDFNNGLDKRDACRLLYLEAINKNLDVKTINTRICDVYRGNKKDYVKLIIYAGLTKRSNGLKLIKTLRSFKRFFLVSLELPSYLINFYFFIEISRLIGIDILSIKSVIKKILKVSSKK